MACTIDFRRLDEGFGGKTYKRKRAEQEPQAHQNLAYDANDLDDTSMEVDVSQPSAKRAAVSSIADPNKPVAFGRPTYDGVIAGKVSGRNWKQPRKRASARAVKPVTVSHEQRAREREVKKAYQARKEELKEVIRSNKIEKRKLREEREKKKKENILKSGTKLQVISNPKTLKKIAKSKKRKQLKVVSDDLIRK